MLYLYIFLSFVGFIVLFHTVYFIIFKIQYKPVLMYHRVTDIKKDESIRYIDHKGKKLDLDSMKVSPNNFELQMAYLNRKKYKTKRMSEYGYKGKNVYITFDDGYSDNYLNAYPILKKYNMGATIYIPSKIIDDRGYLPIDHNEQVKNNRVLTWDELETMKDVFEIGSHTLTHPWLTELDDTSLEEEIKGSKDLIEKRLNIEVTTFASPGGLYDSRSLNYIKENYQNAVITARGLDFPLINKELYQIEREAISSSDTLFMFKLKVWGIHRFLRKLRWFNYIKGLKK